MAGRAGRKIVQPVVSEPDRVTAILAVRDGERYIAEALESIVGQSTPPGEVIVVDDGSTDATPAALEPFAEQVRVMRQEPAGVAAALNRGVAAATGELLAEPSRARALGQGARALAVERYTLDRCADEYDAVYRRLIGRVC